MQKMKEASFYKKSSSGVHCQLCPHFCFLKENCIGKCGVRKNVSGILYSLVYGRPCSIALDPIEKKPFFHFSPGSQTLSVATVGCNFSCKHCQNWEISQYPKIHNEICGHVKNPEEIIAFAKKSLAQGISWTYTEPTIFFEYFFDTAKLDRKKTFYQTWVTNGFTNPPVIRKSSSFLDAVNVDYKGNEKFYRDICGARLEPVLQAIKEYKKMGIWIEITNLLIPGLNDKDDTILEMVKWIRENLGQDIPLHFSAYHPDYRMRAKSTEICILERAVKIADDYLKYVYIGNVSHERENTFCPKCKNVAIKRIGFRVLEFNLERKKDEFSCKKCGEKIPIAGAKWIKA